MVSATNQSCQRRALIARLVRGALGGSSNTRAKSSSAATRLKRSKPHPRQRCTITCSPSGRWNTPTGAIRAPHGLRRSPVRAPSTWRECRQNGQWLRCLPPEGSGQTNRRQCAHLKTCSRGLCRGLRVTGGEMSSSSSSKRRRGVRREIDVRTREDPLLSVSLPGQAQRTEKREPISRKGHK